VTTHRVLPAVLTAAALLFATAAPGSAAVGPPSFVAGQQGFHSVLAYGQGQSASLPDLARNQADGSVPPSFTSQAGLYDQVLKGQPTTDADLARYYKDSSFSVPAGGTSEAVGTATVIRDATNQVPHIYAPTRDAGMFAVGYATAQDRLFLMDVLRRTSEGSTAELLGPSAVPSDSAALGQFDRSPQELTAEVMRLPQDEGAEGARGLTDLQQYVAGINAWIAATRTDPTSCRRSTRRSARSPATGPSPTPPRRPTFVAQFTVAGDGEEKQADILARLKAKLGSTKGKAVYDDLRRLEDPAAPVTTTKRFTSDRPAKGPASANTAVDAASISARSAVASTQSPAAPVVPLKALWQRPRARRHGAAGRLLLPRDPGGVRAAHARHPRQRHDLPWRQPVPADRPHR